MDTHLQKIVDAVRAGFRETLAPIGDRFAFEPGPSPGEIGGPPTVLLVGNHSSGKSTFINYLLDDDVQKTGLAPTDDAFTVIDHAPEAENRDGRALVSDPGLAWDGLASFGPTLLSHLRRKSRPHALLQRVTLVDTPGMIDAAREDSGRGYDFGGVVRWFAERADLVLLFFDPDKPGTTGETIHVFTHALQDLGHKLRVVMNKVDQFGSVQDFARAYGALCWNLAKVSNRKDLPFLYTTYVPLPGSAAPQLPADDFDASREELVEAIRDAPALRVHNLVTRLRDYGDRLRMHCRVIDAAARETRRRRRWAWATLGFGGLLGVFLTVVAFAMDADLWLSGSLAGATVLGGLGGALLARHAALRAQRDAVDGLDATFERIYQRDLLVRERAEDLRALWASVKGRTRRTLETLGAATPPRLRRRDRNALDELVDRRVPELRRDVRPPGRAAPAPPPELEPGPPEESVRSA